MSDQTPDPTCAACGFLAREHQAIIGSPSIAYHERGCGLREADVLRAALRASAAGSEDTKRLDWLERTHAEVLPCQVGPGRRKATMLECRRS